MKFFVLLAFAVVFLTVFTRAEDEESAEEEDNHEPQAGSSALQLNGNNVGDINNIKGGIKILFICLDYILNPLRSNCSDLGRWTA